MSRPGKIGPRHGPVAMPCHPTLINPPDKVQSHLIYLESQWRRAQSSQGGTRRRGVNHILYHSQVQLSTWKIQSKATA